MRIPFPQTGRELEHWIQARLKSASQVSAGGWSHVSGSFRPGSLPPPAAAAAGWLFGGTEFMRYYPAFAAPICVDGMRYPTWTQDF
jgi:hypothetical protein